MSNDPTNREDKKTRKTDLSTNKPSEAEKQSKIQPFQREYRQIKEDIFFQVKTPFVLEKVDGLKVNPLL